MEAEIHGIKPSRSFVEDDGSSNGVSRGGWGIGLLK